MATAALSRVTLNALTRSGLVMAGILLLGVGLGDTIAGRSKIAQYQQLLRTTESVEAPTGPASLFPTASEHQERYELARAKLAFYELLLSAGHILSAVGFALVAAGVLRIRFRASPPVALPQR